MRKTRGLPRYMVLMSACWLAMPVLAPSALALPIYRWVSPEGVVSFGNRPPKDARDVQKIGEQSPISATPPAPVVMQPARKAEQTEQKIARDEELAAKLNLLRALENYLGQRQPQIIHEDRGPSLFLYPSYPYQPHPGPPRPRPPQSPTVNNGLPQIAPWYTGPWPRQTP
ncbi:DUF4124 domain-containing protein [Acidithiobacillus sp. CV18-2]|uniref:DUF4124 domain-containing protein n=1 Tax=Igneacidithiobacillus copahuensis TaxID=2724909 RepID=A0AAE2YP01_9PROT|nr:DUF4124 domain-containing protein [Igneacidithiobacillus copahuensis]MBU2754290.1 DUF4124 domain-containing protein [Acidithiobacillus sp. CV18-3]MBU2757687.1 DUF4124 domain-containing protein [Acidithiobacillus sp. BN09-2]MBU2776998.1 DUF4124 domain-containing protein [Acidithiobacillus sp. CV18-2]MBU2797302.1 DUF4124 domain-containing protein [Acidithiobacillus sp. VAN18-2]MBU2799851.1 DUF4124 domain-containing protein [Acidithiobacillus sp. VAN18-4]